MHRSPRTASLNLCLCFTLGLAACSSTSGTDEASLTKMTFSGAVQTLSDNPVSAGATELCIREYDVLPCGEDDGTGFSMDAPSAVDFVAEINNPSYGPHLLHHRVQAASNFRFPLLSADDIAELEAESGATALGGKGTILLYVSDGTFGASGVSVTITGSGVSGTYYDNLMQPDELLTSTSGAGYVAFVGVDPGTYSVSLGYDLELCGSFFRGINEDGFFEVTVEAGTVTHAGEFECSERVTSSVGSGDTGDESETG